jgi:hypothetical protein
VSRNPFAVEFLRAPKTQKQCSNPGFSYFYLNAERASQAEIQVPLLQYPSVLPAPVWNLKRASSWSFSVAKLKVLLFLCTPDGLSFCSSAVCSTFRRMRKTFIGKRPFMREEQVFETTTYCTRNDRALRFVRSGRKIKIFNESSSSVYGVDAISPHREYFM